MSFNERLTAETPNEEEPNSLPKMPIKPAGQEKNIGCKTIGCSTPEDIPCFKHNCSKPGAGG